jgi:hypothetical protein
VRNKKIVLVVMLILLMAALPAFAVKYGVPDNGEHPYVGLIVFYNAAGAPQWRCSGTLLSPTLMLTAAHCTELEQGAQVWFQDEVLTSSGYPFSGGVTGHADASPWWQGGLFLPNTGDVGVVVLDSPVTHLPAGYDYPDLAPAGYLDSLATQRGQQDTTFEVVGYGLQAVRPVELAQRIRMKAGVRLVNLRSQLTDGYNLHTSNNPGQGNGGPGGTCFGDSGGAIFTDSHQIVAVNSFVLNANCAGASFGYRVDRQEVIDWILNH